MKSKGHWASADDIRGCALGDVTFWRLMWIEEEFSVQTNFRGIGMLMRLPFRENNIDDIWERGGNQRSEVSENKRVWD